MVYWITLIILGLLAAPSLFLSNKPNAKQLLAKITPYQGWLGLGFCIWGIRWVVLAILDIGLLWTFPIWWVTWLVSSLMEALLGFILGYGMINKLILSKNEEAKAKWEKLLARLAPIQWKLGLMGVIVWVWVIVASIFFSGM